MTHNQASALAFEDTELELLAWSGIVRVIDYRCIAKRARRQSGAQYYASGPDRELRILLAADYSHALEQIVTSASELIHSLIERCRFGDFLIHDQFPGGVEIKDIDCRGRFGFSRAIFLQSR
jgi:hypothetical protein